MAADGVGPSQTCASLLSAMARGGLSGPLFVNRARAKRPGVNYQTALPGFLASLPYKYVEATATRRSELCFRRMLREGDIAYLWPHASLQAYHWAKSLGVPIVGEGINSRMASARTILDEAYDAEGLSPGHGITDARIAEEEEKLAMTDIFFAPSPGVESALVGSQLPESALLSTSYGVDLDRAPGALGRKAQHPFAGAVDRHLLGDDLRPGDGEGAVQPLAQIAGNIVHVREIGGATHVEPMPDLADPHANLLGRNSEVGKGRAEFFTVKADQFGLLDGFRRRA